MNPAMVEKFAEAINRLTEKHNQLIIPIPIPEVFSLIGALQLALRHPQFPESSQKIVEQFIYSIRDALSSEPILVDLIRMGFEDRYDEGFDIEIEQGR